MLLKGAYCVGEHFVDPQGCIGSSESTLVKMPHCWKSHVMAHINVNHTVIKFYITRTQNKVTLHKSNADGNMCNFLQK